jgi:hypothetical protein
MREETRRRLDRLDAGARRTKWAAIGVGLATVIGLAFVAFQAPTVREIDAIVRFARIQHNTDTGQPYTTLELELANGKVVQGLSVAPSLPPRPGARIIVSERQYWLGFHSYYWEGKKR